MKRRVLVGLPLYVLGMHATSHGVDPAASNIYRAGLIVQACLWMILGGTESIREDFN
jgi:hypothetical protein